MPTIHDIARKAGVSITTVSRAFRTPGMINEETQRRILDAARQLNYAPRTSNKKPTGTRSDRRTIAFEFFADRPTDTLEVNPFYGGILFGAQTEAARLGINLMVHTTNRHGLEEEVSRLVSDWDLSAIFLVGGLPHRSIAESYQKHIPNLVLVDNRDIYGRYESVSSDGFGGAVQAIQYLKELGHRRIGFLLRSVEDESFTERLRGYQWTMQAEGLVNSEEYNLRLSALISDEERDTQIIRWLQMPNRPTAVLVCNDDFAVAILRLCRQLGIRVPEEMSIIGFDDIPVSEHIDPPLTTLRVKREFMGRLAVRIVSARLAMIEREQRTEPPVQHIVPVDLIVRESCCPPRR